MEIPFLKTRTLTISHSTILFTIALLIGLYVLYQVLQIVALLFLAFIIMVALNPVVKRFQRWGVNRTFSIMLAYSLLFIILSIFIAIVVPPLVTQLIKLFDFLRDTPWLSDQLSIFNGGLSQAQNELNTIAPTINDLGSAIGALSTPFSVAFSIVSAFFSNLLLVFSVFVMAYFLLVERPVLHTKLKWFTKNEIQISRARDFLDRLEEQLGGWVRGELILMLTIGVMTFVGLALLGVPYALPLALLAGLLEVVPNIGPTISAIPAIIIAAAVHGPLSGLAVAMLSFAIQQAENHLIVPRVMKQAAEVSSLVVILIILAGAQLGGVLGALLAVPVYITLRSWYSFYVLPKITA